ncbi:MAG TPA: hypothetical protein VL120_04960 [Solirubrobacteraceae bacterium]|nr:hypothetical protein [Solirubrobacteraceae bacterium]
MALAVALASIAQAAPDRLAARAAATNTATVATFAGSWFGHTRSLKITRGGIASESIGLGCCDPVVDLRLKLSHPRGTNHVASVAVRVTKVVIRDPSNYSASNPAPRVGQTGRFKLRFGVITETLTGTNYCNQAAGLKGTCGA